MDWRIGRMVADSAPMADHDLDAIDLRPPTVTGLVQLIVDGEHFHRVVQEGMLRAEVSLDIATADFKSMWVPAPGAKAQSIVRWLVALAHRGVEIRLLHAGVPSGPALQELARGLPENFVVRRCPRLHAKSVIVDSAKMYLGSANLTGAGLGAKARDRRNFEWGIWTESIALIDAVAQRFNALWEGECCYGCQRRDVCPVPLEEPQL